MASNMRLQTAILYTVVSLLIPLAVASSPSSSSALSASAIVLYWPVTSPQPTILSRVSYDPTSLKSNVLSYDPPNNIAEHNDDDLVRIGLFTSTPTNSKQWVGSLTSLSSLTSNGDHKQTLRLLLGPSNEIYHVSLSLTSSSSPSNTSTTYPDVELVPGESGPRPYLNRPVVVGPDGKGTEEAVEKTLFQK